jgi:quercetin dioxygenase-like cupin family protein
MATPMLLDERPLQAEDAPPETDPQEPPAPRRARPVLPALVMVAGLALMAVAAVVLTRGESGGGPAVDPSAITVSARDVSVVTQVYEPGQTSGWHSHPGIHAVSVTSGVLTVHVSGCPTRTFEPGRPYVGGQEPHMVANETDAPVTMTVTYLNPSSSAQHGVAPTGCPAG